ncbi:hypothetical protein [Bradyrhizobium sp. RDI18]|uniref:hypothetical protein n=1 Tax=Bradyrhizobium sp. RDI18 TaxID=3367400 RepID=UPI003720F78F
MNADALAVRSRSADPIVPPPPERRLMVPTWTSPNKISQQSAVLGARAAGEFAHGVASGS